MAAMRLARSVPALQERRFRFVFLAHAVSVLGDALVPVALAFAVLDLTGSATDLALVLLARIVPMALLTLVGGVWADRVSRRGLIVCSHLARFASQAVLGLLLIAGVADLWEIVVLQAAHGAAGAFYRPAWTGLIPEVASKDHLQEANGLLFMALSVATVLGPAISGVLVATVGSGWALLLDSASFAVAALLLLQIGPLGKVRAAVREPFFRELAAGFGEVRKRTWVWVSILHFSLFQLVFMSTFPVLGPLVAKQSLGGASAWAAIATAFGVGTVVGGVVALRVRPMRPLLACYVVILSTVPSLIMLAIAAPVWAIAATELCSGLAMSFCTTMWESTLQALIPAETLSRVSAYDWVGSVVLRPVGLVLVGPVSVALGVETTLFAAAVALAIGTLIVLAVPSIRQLRRPGFVSGAISEVPAAG
jgi:MFS family permease